MGSGAPRGFLDRQTFSPLADRGGARGRRRALGAPCRAQAASSAGIFCGEPGSPFASKGVHSPLGREEGKVSRAHFLFVVREPRESSLDDRPARPVVGSVSRRPSGNWDDHKPGHGIQTLHPSESP
jgi:hypothetical protein